jgi:HlyD family secretion protein
MKKKTWIWLITLGLGVVVLFWFVGRDKSGKGEEVQTALVEQRNIQELVSASGKIYPSTEVKISSDVSGEIVELFVQEGDSVIKGQLLLKINPDTYLSSVERGNAAMNSAKSQKAIAEAQWQSAIAQREQIEAQLQNARQIYQRNKALYADNAISKLELEASEAGLKGLEANFRASEASVKSAQSNIDAASYTVKSAEATLSELKTSLQRTAIYAPTNGIVSRLNVEKGERVVGTIQMTGTELMRISNLDFMEVQVEVTESDILRLKLDQEAEIEVDAYLGKKFSGKVYQIANAASLPGSGGIQALSADQISNFTVKIRLDPASYSDLLQTNVRPFRPGMSASVNIKTALAENVLAVPVQCVTTRDPEDTVKGDNEEEANGGSTQKQSGVKLETQEVVFVLVEGKAKKIIVSTGLQDDTYLEIKSGLSKDDKVISGPFSTISKKLTDDMPVVESKSKQSN